MQDQFSGGAAAVRLHVDGRDHALRVDPRTTLLDALREHLRITGPKTGCDRGQCGACTVIVEGRRINACLTLALMHDGERVTTVEGLGGPNGFSPLQEAFIEHDAFQCGYCTPGQLCSATALLAELAAGEPSAASADLLRPPAIPDDGDIRERMSGNLCRCGAYPGIVAAVRSVILKGACHAADPV
jgi:xanthine dehydrogenase YagT iron-sulfur-binding subunit